MIVLKKSPESHRSSGPDPWTSLSPGGGDSRGVQIKELREPVHGEAGVARSKREGFSLQHQGSEAGKRAQGIQQGPLVLELTVPQVQTHQPRPEKNPINIKITLGFKP